MQSTAGEFEGAVVRLGMMTERTPSPPLAIESAGLRVAEAKLAGTTMCLGRAGRPAGSVRLAAWVSRGTQWYQRPSGGSTRGMLTSPSPSRRTRRGWQSATRLEIAHRPRPLQSASLLFDAALLERSGLMVEERLLQWERTGRAQWRKPLKLQVMPSPKRVSATRGRNQWGQKKS